MKHIKLLSALTLLFLSIGTWAAGTECSDPFVAQLGENQGSTAESEQWFSFTAESEGYYAFDISGIGENDYLPHDYYTDCENQTSDYEDAWFGARDVSYLDAGESILLHYKTSSYKGDFTLTISIPQTGDIPQMPIEYTSTEGYPVPEGTNTIFFKITISEAQTISFPLNNGYASVEGDSYNDIDETKYDEGIYLLKTAGDYIVGLAGLKGEAFTWQPSYADPLQGEWLSLPVILTESESLNLPDGLDEMYYEYTAPADGFIMGSKINAYFKVRVKGEYDKIKSVDATDYSFRVPVSEGTTYTITYSKEYGAVNEGWQFTVDDGKGLTCENPFTIDQFGEVEGTGAISYYKFTIPKDGAFTVALPADIINEGEGGHQLALYKVDEYCYEVNSVWNQNLVFEASEGETYIIKTSGTNWTLIDGAPEGTACSKPIKAGEPGTFTFPAKAKEMFLEYTPTRDCKLAILDGNSQYRLHAKFDCETKQAEHHSDEGELAFPVTAYQPVLIRWSTDYAKEESFDFTIEEKDFEPGDRCNNPLVIEEMGTYTFTNKTLPFYYAFVPTITGKLKFSDDAYRNKLTILESKCSEDNAISSEDKQTISTFKGDTVYFVYESYYEDDFEWTVEEIEADPGETCGTALTAELDTPVELQSSTVFYYTYTAEKNGILSLSSDERIYAEISKECVNSSYEYSRNFSHTVHAGETYLIYIKTYNLSGTEITFSLEEVAEGEHEDFPIMINLNETVSAGSGSQKYYRFITANESVYFFEYNTEEITINHATPGLLPSGADITFSVDIASADAEFSLQTRDPYPGEYYSYPATVEAGEIKDNEDMNFLYYRYTASDDLTVTFDIGGQAWLEIYLPDNDFHRTDTILSFEAKAGESFVFYVPYKSESQKKSFSISERAPETGESNNLPSEISATDENIALIRKDIALAKSYYSYTPSVKQKVTITPVEYNLDRLLVVDQATNDTIYEEMYSQSAVFTLERNQTYIISIIDENSKEAWNIETEDLEDPAISYTFSIKNDDAPIEGAVITIGELQFTTDSEGKAVADLMPGSYDYTVTISGFKTETGTIFPSEASIGLSLIMEEDSEPTYSIEFNVSSTEGELTSAFVSIFDQQISLDENGKATVELKNGNYTYTIKAIGFKDISGEIKVEGQSVSISPALIPADAETFQASFTILGDEEALEEASLTINGTSFLTNAEGIATVELPNGTYNFELSMTGFKTQTGTVTIDGTGISESYILVKEVTAVNENSTVTVTPVPAFDEISVFSATPAVSLQLVSVSGNIVKEKTENCTTLDLSDLKPGLYILKVNYEENSQTVRIVKK